MHWPITRKKMKPLTENLLRKKSPGPNGFSDEFWQAFNEELIPISPKLFPKKLKRRENSLIHSEDNITLPPKQWHHKKKKKHYRSISLMKTGAEICKQNTRKLNPASY